MPEDWDDEPPDESVDESADEAARLLAIREFLRPFLGDEVVAGLSDERLPRVKYFDDVRHGDALIGRPGDWIVIGGERPLANAAVDVLGSTLRIVVEPHLVSSTLTARSSGCTFFMLGDVQDSKVEAVGLGSKVHLLGHVGGKSKIRAEHYTAVYAPGSDVNIRAQQEDLPPHLLQQVPPSPPTYAPPSDLAARQRPRSPRPARRARWWLGPDPTKSSSDHLRR